MTGDSMNERPLVLIVDPDQVEARRSGEVLARNGFAVQVCVSPEEALAFQARDHVRVIWTRALEDRVAFQQYLEALALWFPAALTVAYSQNPQPGTDRSNHQLYDHVHKPASVAELVAQVRRAADFQRELQQIRELDQMNRDRFRNRLEWLLWKRTQESHSLIDYGVRLVSNLRHAILQGEGVGNLVAQTEMLTLFPRGPDGAVPVPADMVDQMQGSARAVRSWLSSLERFASIDCTHYEAESLDQASVRECIMRSIEDVERFRTVGDQKLRDTEITFPGHATCNGRALKLCLRELLTNAYKYSPSGSSISLVCFSTGTTVSLGLINDIVGADIPEESLEQALLPFARISNVYKDAFLDEELGLGIGLPVVMDALQQTGGAFFLRTIVDHTRETGPVKRIMAEIVLQRSASQEAVNDPALEGSAARLQAS